MDPRTSGRRPGRILSALVGAGGLVVAFVTGTGLWFGHLESESAASTTTSTSTSTVAATSIDAGTSGVTSGTGCSVDTQTTGS